MQTGGANHGQADWGPGSEHGEVEWPQEHEEVTVPARPSIGAEPNDPDAEFDLPFTD